MSAPLSFPITARRAGLYRSGRPWRTACLLLALWAGLPLLPGHGNPPAGAGQAWAQDGGGDDGGDDGDGGAGGGRAGAAGTRGGDGRSDSDTGIQEPAPRVDPGRSVAQELVGVNPSAAALRRAGALGLQVVQTQRLGQLGLVVVRLRVPPGLDARTALALAEERDPGVFDLHHRFRLQQGNRSEAPAGACDLPGCEPLAQIGWPASARCGAGQTVGLVDGPVARSATGLRGLDLQQRRLAPPGSPPADEDHGTAVALLLAGQPSGGFQGLLPAARLRVAVPFYRLPDGQVSADAFDLAASLDWLVGQGTDVIGLSLSGPPNRVLAAAVREAQARGAVLVAAVGNEGRAAPPAHPAALDGVLGVTALAADGRLYWRAGQGAQVDFALPGVGVSVPQPDGQLQRRNGTSFAVPYLVAQVSQSLAEGRTAARQWRDGSAIPVNDLGPRGRDDQYGWGLPRPALQCR